MTLSVLIPTYNYNARVLVESMAQLASAESITHEIIVGDDASTCETEWLAAVEGREDVRVLHNPVNLGRARNRNRMAEAARGEWLLFIDCDAQVETAFSLRTYLQAGEHVLVVCGGLHHPASNPNPKASLRYAYERRADRYRSATHRQQHPYEQLSTFNLLVRRDVFLAIRFDEQCTQYGYEDVLFGADLQRHGISILHIDDPLLHVGLEPNDVFLAKTETALHTLHQLGQRMKGHSRLATTANRLRRWHLAPACALAFRLLHRPLRHNLLSAHPSLTLFSLYKLGYFLQLQTKR